MEDTPIDILGNKSHSDAQMLSNTAGSDGANGQDQPGNGRDTIWSNPFFTNRATSRTWSPEKEKVLFGPYDYLDGIPGKDIRSQLIAAFNNLLKVPPEPLRIITRVVSMLHTASLL